MEIAIQLVVLALALAAFWVLVRPLALHIFERAAGYWRYYTIGISALAAVVGAVTVLIRWGDPLLALIVAVLAVDIFLPLTWARWRVVAALERRATGNRS